jgi:hypothetical protein
MRIQRSGSRYPASFRHHHENHAHENPGRDRCVEGEALPLDKDVARKVPRMFRVRDIA